MNILYFISSSGNASGGHYHSLNQISKEVGKGNNVRIITTGPETSPVLSENRFFLKHISIQNNFKSLFILNKELKQIIKNFNPDILHCFDTDSLNRLLILPAVFHYPIILNKCGGPNPRRSNYQHANEIIVFSAENYDWFKMNRHYNNGEIHLIANRVEELQFLPTNKRIEKKNNKIITFLRVTRIGGAYDKTLRDSFRMIEELMLHFPVQLIIVGRIQDQERYQWFYNEADNKKLPVQFITDKRASKGADFLYLADFVIGTGRSFMEALSLGIPTLTPAQNANWPIIVNERNFNDFFKTNFSERNKTDNKTIINNKDEIIRLIKSQSAYYEAQESARTLFKKYFGTEHILTKYNDVYRLVLSKPKKRFSLLLKNFPYILKYLLWEMLF